MPEGKNIGKKKVVEIELFYIFSNFSRNLFLKDIVNFLLETIILSFQVMIISPYRIFNKYLFKKL